MQQVARSIREKRKRDRLRSNIQSITPHQYSNSVRYYHEPTVPHEVLAHQFQHLNRYAYNKKEEISARQIYPISQALVYEPLRYNQLQAEYHRSKSLNEGNEFLNGYDEQEHRKRKNEYFSRIRVIQMAKKQEEEARINDFKQIRKQNERNMRQSVVLPPIRSKNAIKRLKVFRSAAWAVYFICLARLRLRKSIRSHKQLCLQYHKSFIKAAIESMQHFYYNKVQKQITQYMILLEKKLKYANYNTDSDILAILTSLFQKVDALPVPKAILQALSVISCSYSSFPVPFLFTEELKRIPYVKQEDCTGSLSEEQSYMLTACFIVIKLFCFNLFYRPWLAQDLFRKNRQKYIDFRSKYGELRKIINHMGSLPYFIVIDSFLLNCPILNSQAEIEQLAKEGHIYTIPFMQVIPRQAAEVDDLVIDSSDEEIESVVAEVTSGKGQKETEGEKGVEDKASIIVNQNRGFYVRMREANAEEMKRLEKAITQWVTKITLTVLRLSDQSKQEKAQKLHG